MVIGVFVLVLTLGVIYYIIYYIIIIYYILYIYYYYIYYTLLSSDLSPLLFPISSLPILPFQPLIHSIRVGTYIYLLILFHSSDLSSVLFSSSIPLPILLFLYNPLLIYSSVLFLSPLLFQFQSSHSKYTCRHLDILIYIPDSSNF